MSTCADLYNCCSCGVDRRENEDAEGCGCRECFDCNACQVCLNHENDWEEPEDCENRH